MTPREREAWALVDDLAALLKSLVHATRQSADPTVISVRARADEFLRRKNLMGSTSRAEEGRS